MTRLSLVAVAALALSACQTEAPDATTAPDSTATAADAPTIEAGTYQIDPAHSEVGFRVKHLGISNVDGRFSDVDGTVTVPAGGAMTGVQTDVTIQAASINTRNDDRDNHLQSADFFDAATFPTLTFRSTTMEPLGGNRFTLTGDLTMHGVTKPVTLEGEYNGAATAPDGTKKVAFSASGTINRSEWGLTWNKALETGGVVVSDEVELTLEVEANSTAPVAAAEPGV